MRRSLLLLLLSALVGNAAPRPVADLETIDLGPGLALLRGGPDGNVLVVSGADGVLLVDGQSPHQVEPVQAALAALDAGPVRIVVNTHYHEDHVGMNATLVFVDLWHGGSIDGLIAAVETLLTLSGPDTRFAPGHGPVLDRSRVVAYRDMLATLRGRVAAALEQGQTLEQLLETDPAAGLGWGSPRGGRRLAALIFLDLSDEG